MKCNSGLCTSCESPLILNSSGYCDRCNAPKNILINNTNGSFDCAKCSYYIDNCDECLNPNECTKCENNHYLNLIDGACINCTKESYPNMYSSGSNKGIGLCILCSAPLENCINCNGDENNCFLCEPKYYVDSQGKCIKNCSDENMIEDSSNQCRNCSDIYPYCDLCNITNKSCLKCKENYYFDNENKCAPCSSLDVYKEGDLDGSGFCKSCALALDNCNMCNNSQKCLKCNKDYYLNHEAHCTKCEENSMFIGRNDDGNEECFLCSSKIDKCINCFGNSSFCGLCEANHYFLEHTGCVSCDIEHFPYFFKEGKDDGTGKCIKCSKFASHCDICEGDLSKCKKCEQGFYFKTNGQCSDCSDQYMVKYGGDLGFGFCKFCENCTECSVIIPHCNLCSNKSKNETICDECYDDFYLENNACKTCSKECSSCLNVGDECIKCASDYYFDSTNKKHCIICKGDDKIINDGICYTISIPSPKLNNSVITGKDTQLNEIDNQLYLIADDLCLIQNQTLLGGISYIIGSNKLNFDKYDLNTIKQRSNKTEYDYEDDEWKLFGTSDRNNLKILLRYSFEYTLKYFCLNDFNDLKSFQYNLIHIQTKENKGSNLTVFMNFENLDISEKNNNILLKIVCIFENMTNLLGKNLIKINHKGKFITCRKNNDLRRTLKQLNGEELLKNTSNNFNLQTVLLKISINPLLFIDNTSFIVNSTIRNISFLHSFNEKFKQELYLLKIKTTNAPTLTSLEFVPEFSKEFIELPLISITLVENLNDSALFNIEVLKQNGFIIMGLIENNAIHPSFQSLKKEENNNTVKYLFRQSFLIQNNQNYSVKISNLSTKHSYALFYATENLLFNDHSEVFSIKFTPKILVFFTFYNNLIYNLFI